MIYKVSQQATTFERKCQKHTPILLVNRKVNTKKNKTCVRIINATGEMVDP